MKNKLIILLLILLLGITLRVYAFSQISSVDKFTLLGDPATYYDLGENIEQGKGPVIDFVFQFWHRADFGENDALWEPVLPYTLAILFFLFGPSILLGKILVFVFSIASIVLIYFIGKVVYNEYSGLIASFLLAIHPKHIEYSISMFKDNIYIFFFLLAFLFLFLAFKYSKLIYWILLGIFLALAFLTRYITAALILTLVILLILNRKKINWKYVLLGVIVFIIILIPWACYTYTHLGQPFFSITKYYSYSSTGWEGMSFESRAPTIQEYLQENSFIDIIITRLKLIPLTLYYLPIWFNPFIFIFVLLLFFIKDDYSKNLKLYFLIFIILYFIQFSNINLFIERGFFALICASLVPIGFIISKIHPFIKKNKIKINSKLLLAFVLIVITISSLALLQWKLSEIKGYHMLERQNDLQNLGNWVKTNIPEDGIIMTILPENVNYYTNRRTVMDPYSFAINMGYNSKKYVNRSKEEILYYNVNYILIHTDSEEALGGFKDLNLELVYSDKEAELFLYIIKT